MKTAIDELLQRLSDFLEKIFGAGSGAPIPSSNKLIDRPPSEFASTVSPLDEYTAAHSYGGGEFGEAARTKAREEWGSEWAAELAKFDQMSR